MRQELDGRSLRARLGLGLAAVSLPFILAAAIGAFYLLPSLLRPMENIIREVVDELEPVRHAQVALLTAGLAFQHRDRQEPSGEFSEMRAMVDGAFDKVRAAPFAEPEERALVDSAWREWQQALKTEDSRSMVFHAESAVTMLDGIYAPARREIEKDRAEAQVAKTWTVGVTFAAFLLALAISLYTATRLAGPIVVELEVLRQGAVHLARGDLSHRVGSIRTPELRELGTAFNAMAVRIEKDQVALVELATRDGLTALFNRGEFLRLLREELVRSSRYGHPCTLLLLDIDHFKAVNDTWGHPAGDVVLRAVAERIAAQLRPTDRAARYGGEEFAVLLPETLVAGGLSAAERIRAAIAATPISLSSEKAISITTSLGVAAYPSSGTDEQALIASADAALYAAKNAGRNRSMIAPTRPADPARA